MANRNLERALASRKAWFVYILLCSDNSFYIGISPNVNKRLNIHNSGKGAKHTRERLPVKLVYSKKFINKSQARNRKKKELLIKGLLK
jgi:putative endonuclease